MAKFPALPLWTDALIGDTFHLTPAQFGAYLRLLIVEWRTPDCSLPNDDIFLGRSVGDPKNWHRLKPVVMPYFTLGDDGRYRQKRLLDERDSCSRWAAKSSAGGSAKALKRQNRDSTNSMPNVCQTPAPIPISIPIPIKEGSSKSGASAPFDDRFELFWSAFPRKDGSKSVAAKEFSQAKGDPEMIIAGARAYSQTEEVQRDDGKFAVGAVRWLQERRWLDQPKILTPDEIEANRDKADRLFNRGKYAAVPLARFGDT